MDLTPNERRAFDAIKSAASEVLFDLETKEIAITSSLRDLGANSLDRAEILTLTMESLGVERPLVEFANARNIRDLVELLAG